MKEKLAVIAQEMHPLPAGSHVVVAMSGGVDSSLTAAALHHLGFQVTGITMQLTSHGAKTTRTCCAGQDIHDAGAVARRLGIAHYVLDAEELFRAHVQEPFAKAYARGETPLPCADCNAQVKFTHLLATAQDLGATALATGHYARRAPVGEGWGLFSAHDTARDQTYFLSELTQEQLAYLRFPLGSLSKPDARLLAQQMELKVAHKPDSQDICFVPHGDYRTVVELLHPEAHMPGEIVHTDGRVLGRHEGVYRFTLGQRRKLGISTGEPLYVVHINAETREVVVGSREALATQHIHIREFAWITPTECPEEGRDVYVQVRSQGSPHKGRIFVRERQAYVVLENREEGGAAAGQACVVMTPHTPTGWHVLGGGRITQPPASAPYAPATTPQPASPPH